MVANPSLDESLPAPDTILAPDSAPDEPTECDSELKIKELEAEIENLTGLVTKSTEALKRWQADNNALRSQIVRMQSPALQHLTDAGYNNKAIQLNRKIESFVSRSFRKECKLSNDGYEMLYCTVVDPGERLKTLVKNKIIHIIDWYNNKNTRIFLLRHLIARFLYDHVFRQFCFAADPTFDKNLKHTFKILLSTGSSAATLF